MTRMAIALLTRASMRHFLEALSAGSMQFQSSWEEALVAPRYNGLEGCGLAQLLCVQFALLSCHPGLLQVPCSIVCVLQLLSLPASSVKERHDRFVGLLNDRGGYY